MYIPLPRGSEILWLTGLHLPGVSNPSPLLLSFTGGQTTKPAGLSGSSPGVRAGRTCQGREGRQAPASRVIRVGTYTSKFTALLRFASRLLHLWSLHLWCCTLCFQGTSGVGSLSGGFWLIRCHFRSWSCQPLFSRALNDGANRNNVLEQFKGTAKPALWRS